MGGADDPGSESPKEVCLNKEDFLTQEAKFKTGNKWAWVSLPLPGPPSQEERKVRRGEGGRGQVGQRGQERDIEVEKGNRQEAGEAAGLPCPRPLL